jgi:hypothetical protein
MGFAIYYRSTRRVSRARADVIRKAAVGLCGGRTWLSCEPVGFHSDLEDGRLAGFSKPNFLPNPDDAASAAREALPDGTALDMLEVLCRLSRDHGVDWEVRHDDAPEPVGYIRGGVCEPELRERVEALADLGDILSDLEAGDEAEPGGRGAEDEDDGGPQILPFQPRNS